MWTTILLETKDFSNPETVRQNQTGFKELQTMMTGEQNENK